MTLQFQIGFSQVIVRKHKTVEKYVDIVDWVWIDTNTKLPLDEKNIRVRVRIDFIIWNLVSTTMISWFAEDLTTTKL